MTDELPDAQLVELRAKREQLLARLYAVKDWVRNAPEQTWWTLRDERMEERLRVLEGELMQELRRLDADLAPPAPQTGRTPATQQHSQGDCMQTTIRLKTTAANFGDWLRYWCKGQQLPTAPNEWQWSGNVFPAFGAFPSRPRTQTPNPITFWCGPTYRGKDYNELNWASRAIDLEAIEAPIGLLIVHILWDATGADLATRLIGAIDETYELPTAPTQAEEQAPAPDATTQIEAETPAQTDVWPRPSFEGKTWADFWRWAHRDTDLTKPNYSKLAQLTGYDNGHLSNMHSLHCPICKPKS